MRRPDSYASLQPTHSTIVSIINPSYRCLPAASKHTALPRSHLPHQPNPHSGVRGILRAPSPAGSFLGAFRTPTTGVCRAAVAGRHPKPSTVAGIQLALADWLASLAGLLTGLVSNLDIRTMSRRVAGGCKSASSASAISFGIDLAMADYRPDQSW